MERSNLDKASDHVNGIDRSYPHWPSTFGRCSTEGCEGNARGAGWCADCHEKALAVYAGADAAREYHSAVKTKAEAYGKLCDAIETEG